MLAIEETVGSEMDDAILAQLPTGAGSATGTKIQGFEPGVRRSDGQNSLGFVPGHEQAAELAAYIAERARQIKIGLIASHYLAIGGSVFNAGIISAEDGVGKDGDCFWRGLTSSCFASQNSQGGSRW